MDRDSKLRLFRKSLYAPHWLRVARDGLADQLARPPANRVGSHSHEILLNSSLESYSCRGRVAQLGEHLLCKHEPAFQSFHPLLCAFNVSNNFGESASRSK